MSDALMADCQILRMMTTLRSCQVRVHSIEIEGAYHATGVVVIDGLQIHL